MNLKLIMYFLDTDVFLRNVTKGPYIYKEQLCIYIFSLINFIHTKYAFYYIAPSNISCHI